MKNTKKNHKFEHVNLHVQNHKNVWTLHFGCSRRRSIGSVSTVLGATTTFFDVRENERESVSNAIDPDAILVCPGVCKILWNNQT